MALAKYRRTSHGSRIVSTGRDKIQMPDTGSVQRMQNLFDSLASRKQADEESIWKDSLRKGLLTGTMSEVTYYNSLASYYEKKMNASKNPVDRASNEVAMLTNLQSAQRASESEASAAEKANNAKLTEIKTYINQQEEVLNVGLSNGFYKDFNQYIDAVDKVYNVKKEMLNEVIKSGAFSESTIKSANNELSRIELVADNVQDNTLYGGLNYKKENKDSYFFLQNKDGRISADRIPQLKNAVDGVGYDIDGNKLVEGKDGIWRRTTKLLSQQPDGSYMYFDPKRNMPVRIGADEADKIASLQDAEAVYVVDPQDPNNVRLWYSGVQWEVSDNGEWKRTAGDGKKWVRDDGIVLDSPAFGNVFAENKQRFSGFEKKISSATTPFIPGAVGYQNLAEGGEEQVVDPYKVSEDAKLDVPKFKEPSLKREKTDTGYKYFRDNQEISIDDYSKETGISKDKLLAGSSVNNTNNPLDVINMASKSSLSGYNSFKKLFNKFKY